MQARELDPEAYHAAVIRGMPYWPKARPLELTPHYRASTRARLAPAELDRALGHISVPPPPNAEDHSATR